MKHLFALLLFLQSITAYSAGAPHLDLERELISFDQALFERNKGDVKNGIFHITSLKQKVLQEDACGKQLEVIYQAHEVIGNVLDTSRPITIVHRRTEPNDACVNASSSSSIIPQNYFGFLSLRCEKNRCSPAAPDYFTIDTKALYQQYFEKLLKAKELTIDDDAEQERFTQFINARLDQYYAWRAQHVYAQESARDPIMLFLRGVYEECGKQFNRNGIVYYVRSAKMGYPLAQQRIDNFDSKFCKQID